MRVVIDTNVLVSAVLRDRDPGDFTDAQKLLTTTILSVSQFKKLVCEGLDAQ